MSNDQPPSKEGRLIDCVSLFAFKTIDTLQNHHENIYHVFYNKTLHFLLQYKTCVLEFYEDYGNITRRIADPDEVLEATLNHIYSVELLAKGAVRVKIFTGWWFDIYTTLSEEWMERKIYPLIISECKFNDKLLDNEVKYCEEIMAKIEYYKRLAGIDDEPGD